MTIKELPELLFWILVILGGGLLSYAAHGYFFVGKQDDATSPVPDLRAYNDPRFVKALNGSDRQKLISLIASGQLTTWARPMTLRTPIDGRDSDLVEVDPKDWAVLRIEPQPTLREDMNGYLTFLQRNSDRRAVKYDLHLNNAQFSRFWPQNGSLIGIDFGLWKAFSVPIIVLAIGVTAMSYPQWKRLVFPSMERALGVGRAVILPYPRDKRLLEVQVEIKNTSNQYIQYQTSGFWVRVGDDYRLNAKGLGPATIIPSQVQTIFSGPFEIGENKTNATLAGVDIFIEYGRVEGRAERSLVFSIACDFVLGEKTATLCMNLRNQDVDD